jgi:Fe-S cluster biogenesis protein NfuA
MSKFRNWLEKWFGIPAEENDDNSSAIKTSSVSGELNKFHVLRVQPTPNPNAFQFVINTPIIETGSKTFSNADEAIGDPLTEALFQIYGVESVYINESFITITKSETIGWHTIFDKIGEIIEKKIHFYNSVDEKAIAQNKPEMVLDKFHKEDFPNCDVKEKILIIEAVLDQAIRPALANDGGGVEVLGIEGNVISVHYQGACGTCPSSTTGTLSYIETFLKDTLHRDLSVVAK